MEKNVVVVLLALVFILPLFSAASIQFMGNVENASFSQGQTIIAQISGNFLNQITTDNVFFYKNEYATRVPASIGVLKSGDDYYLYGILGNYAEGTYTLSLENLKYMQGTQISEENLVNNFTVSNSTADFSVSPGVKSITNATSFSLSVQNLQDASKQINIETPEGINTQNLISSISLKSGETKAIDFSLDSVDSSLAFINLSSGQTYYSVPITISQSQVVPKNPSFDMDFEPSAVSASLATSSDAKRIIYLRNTGDTFIENVSLNLSDVLAPYVTISPEEISELGVNVSKKITLDIASDEKEATLEGKIFATSENVTSSLTLVLDFVKDYVPPTGQESNVSSEDGGVVVTSCSDLEGTICASGQECSGETAYTNDGVCCLATCNEAPKSSRGKWIGWGIIILILIFVIWFFKKRYRGVKRESDLAKLMKKK